MLTLFDWSIWGLYLVCISISLWFFRTQIPTAIKKYFLSGFIIKVFGGVAFTLIYLYHYNGVGDTFLYHSGSSVLANVFFESPIDYFRLLFSEAGNLPFDLSHFGNEIFYSATSEEWFMVKLLSPFTIIAFKSYIVTTLLLSVVSFYGSWKLFLVFNDFLPSRSTLAFAAAFLVPSTVFWGSGIVKDNFTMVGINVMIYALYFGLGKKVNIKLVLVSLLWAYLILKLKAYILISFLPSYFVIWYFFVRNRANNKAVKLFLTPILLILLGIISFVSFQNLGSLSEQYNQDNIKRKLVGFHTWHATIGESAYTLGEVEYTPLGVAKKIPIALATTFFKPFVWNARNPVILMSALESLFVLVLFLTVSIKTRLYFYKYLKSRFFRSLVIFILLFGFVVGFTSYNYGALSRYKLPIMPLFIFILLYMYTKHKDLKEAKRKHLNSEQLQS